MRIVRYYHDKKQYFIISQPTKEAFNRDVSPSTVHNICITINDGSGSPPGNNLTFHGYGGNDDHDNNNSAVYKFIMSFGVAVLESALNICVTVCIVFAYAVHETNAQSKSKSQFKT
jgi:hypothetical protein